jgi:NADH-quinone oxidoreductase subunit G
VRVLHVLAAAMDVDLALPDVATARAEIAELGEWDGDRAGFPSYIADTPAVPGAGEAVLATWPLLLDAGRLQDGEPFLAGTARAAHARVSTSTAAAVGVTDGETLTVSTDRGSISVAVVVAEMPDGVVWLPTNSDGCAVRSELAAGTGSIVRLTAGEGGAA